MDALQYWTVLGEIVDQAVRTSNGCAMATVNSDGSPHVAPIGSLFLQEAGRACYFEKFPKITRANLEQDQRVCILAAPSGFWFFLRALCSGQFGSAPGVRLQGRAGVRREATGEELRLVQDRLKSYRIFRRLPGYKALWGDMRFVREITIDSFEPLRLGAMTQDLWQDASAHGGA
ncbi:MAG: pyridoxamine 5'-phosphate oxidase family protein [Solidesulfovibrio sp.]